MILWRCVGIKMTGIFTYGIDVSHYSKKIDWAAVVAQKVHFAFAKATEVSAKGTKSRDQMFDTYWSDLAKQNIKRGAYHFCHPGADPDASMAFFFSVYAPKSGDLLPTLDVEDQYADVTSVPRKEKVQQIGRMVELISGRLSGRKPIIYTKQRVWTALGNPGDFGGAAYPVDSGFPRCSVLSDRIGAVARADTDGEGSVARGVPEVVSRRGELRGIFIQVALAGWFCVSRLWRAPRGWAEKPTAFA